MTDPSRVSSPLSGSNSAHPPVTVDGNRQLTEAGMGGRRLALLTVGMAVVAAGCGGGGHKVRSLAASTPTTAADTTTVADADTSQAGSDYGRYGQPAATTATTASPATTKAPSKAASPAPAAAGSNSSNPQPSPSSTQAPATT